MSDPSVPATPGLEAKSILDSVKKTLGLRADYDAFDPMIIMHINSTFLTLNQLGVGPRQGFEIEDATAVWADFIGSDPNLNAVKTYISLKVKLLFDPPETGFTQTAMEKLITETEWRLNVHVENGGIVHGVPAD